MPNRYESAKNKLNVLLQSRLTTPDFQRAYSWDKPVIETFWQDIKLFSDKYPNETFLKEEYFLGSVVLVDLGDGSARQILDGQQRLATATILLAVLRDKYHQLNAEPAASDIQTRLIGRYDTYSRQYERNLALNKYDRDFFAREIQEPSYNSGYLAENPIMESHRLIRDAFSYFKGQIEIDLREIDDQEEKIKYIARLQKILTEHMSVVVVSSDDEDEASVVFETLNDRGIGLSASDLVRNLILRRAEESTRDEVMGNWRDILDIEPEAASEDFLRHYWLSREGDVKARSLYREIKMYVTTSNMRSLELSRDLSAEARVYADILEANDPDPEMKKLLEGFNILGAKSLLPPLLSAYKVGNAEEKKKFISNLLTLHARHIIIGNLEGSKLETFLYELARKLRQDSDFNTAKNAMISFAPSDQEFEAKFKLAQVPKSPAARYILREIEYKRRPSTNELKINDLPNVNLEHIYPLNPKAGKLPNHADLVYRIGNLTLVSKKINSTLKNASFLDKKRHYALSEFLITKELDGFTEWTDSSIEERQNSLASDAVQIWKFI